MKDIVENRSRIDLAGKLKLARLVLAENGPVWTTLLAVYHLSSALANRAYARMDRLRRDKGLPGLNSPAINALLWDRWNWAAGGEEWTQSEEWKHSVVAGVLRKYVRENSDIVEIGPGAGRWTEYLLPRARRLYGVDISQQCVTICRQKFAAHPNADFFVNDGASLAGIPDASVDVIWSFDVFVHINESEVARYVDEFVRVLRSGGRGIIHHGTVAGRQGGWRSNLTAESFNALLRAAKLRLVVQFDEWADDGRKVKVGGYGDAISVFEK